MNPTKTMIWKLLDEAPRVAEGDAPAIQCHVLLRGQIQPMFGSLSRTTFDGLRLATVSRVQHQSQAERTVLLEQFFDADDVACLMVEREIKMEAPRIITAQR